MNLNKLIFALFLIATSHEAISQNFYSTEVKSEIINPKNNETTVSIIGQIGTDYITSSTNSEKTILELRDQNFGIKISKDMAKITGIGTDDLVSSYPLILKNKLFLFYVSYNKPSKETSIYIQEIELSELSATGNPEKLSTQKMPETDNKMMMSINGFGHANIMKESRQIMIMMLHNLIYSPDHSKVLFCTSPSFNDKTNGDKFTMLVVDENAKLVWENSSVELSILSTDFDISKIKLSNEGNVYISGIEYVNKNTKKAGLDYEHYNHLFTITEKGKKIKDFCLNEKIGFIYSFDFNFDSKNNLKLAGFYSAKGRSYTDGVFTAQLDAQKNELIFSEKNEVRFNFTEYGKSKKAVEGLDINKKTKGIDFVIDQVFVHDDGTYTMIAEKMITFEENLLGNYRSSFTINQMYGFNDIIAVNIDKDGKVNWSKLVPKNHSSYYAKNGFGYAVTEKNKEIFIVRNESSENKGKSPSELENLTISDEINTLITKISADGTVEEEIFRNSLKKDLKAISILLTSYNQILIIFKFVNPSTADEKKYQLSLLKF